MVYGLVMQSLLSYDSLKLAEERLLEKKCVKEGREKERGERKVPIEGAQIENLQ